MDITQFEQDLRDAAEMARDTEDRLDDHGPDFYKQAQRAARLAVRLDEYADILKLEGVEMIIPVKFRQGGTLRDKWGEEHLIISKMSKTQILEVIHGSSSTQ